MVIFFDIASESSSTSITATPIIFEGIFSFLRISVVSSPKLIPKIFFDFSSTWPLRKDSSLPSNLPNLTVTVLFFPSRINSTLTLLPISVFATLVVNSLILLMSLSPNLIITSPVSIPALSAGPPLTTSCTSAPLSSFKSISLATSSVTS